MNTNELLVGIDKEIARLSQIRNLLAGHTNDGHAMRTPAKIRKMRVMSAEARERIAAAQRKRWAAQKKAAN